MVRLIFAGQVTGDKQYKEYAGLSTDDKPTEKDLATGSRFHELDTATIYAFDEASGTYYTQIELGGGGE